MTFEYADRIKRLPPYLFAEIERLIKEKKAQGVDLISLSVGDPDLPPPDFVIDALREEVSNRKKGASSAKGFSAPAETGNAVAVNISALNIKALSATDAEVK